MATFPTTHTQESEQKLTVEEAAAELYKIVESHYASRGLSEEERDARYAAAAEYLNTKDAENAKAQ